MGVSDDFGTFIILGVIILLVAQIFVNIGTNVGLVPVIGVSLPLVSYGGSSLIMILIMMGIVQSIIVRSKV